MLYIEYSCSNLLQCLLLVSLNKTLHWLGLDVSATVKEQQYDKIITELAVLLLRFQVSNWIQQVVGSESNNEGIL